MKVALCTPLHVHSAIARVSVSVANELVRRGHAVTLINIERTPGSTVHEGVQEQISWKDRQATVALQHAGAIVVQIGDNYDYHAGAISILHDFRCVGIFHDANIQNLFRMWAFDGKSDSEAMKLYDATVRKLYGDDPELQTPETDQHSRLDMLRWLASQCSSALVHANFYKKKIQDFCPGPVITTPLTYDARQPAKAPDRVATSRLSVLTFGHINTNKCCDLVIEAIGHSKIRTAAEYRIVGPVTEDERQRLAALAAKHQVETVIAGRVTDADIADELQLADIVCCLRKPILEGGSASAIESMLSSRPIMVANAGFYAEIDDDAAVKLSADFSADEIQTALERLAADAEARHAIAQRGREWAVRNCSIEHYVDKLEMAIASAIAVEPQLELSSTYVNQLRQLGLDEDHAPFFEVADCLQSLFPTDASAD
jgi:glycosyltransferase involved in cell wall biosynthesis